MDLGFRIIGLSFFNHIFIQSGINLKSDQSPPPITLPALAEQILILFFCFLYKFYKRIK